MTACMPSVAQSARRRSRPHGWRGCCAEGRHALLWLGRRGSWDPDRKDHHYEAGWTRPMPSPPPPPAAQSAGWADYGVLVKEQGVYWATLLTVACQESKNAGKECHLSPSSSGLQPIVAYPLAKGRHGDDTKGKLPSRPDQLRAKCRRPGDVGMRYLCCVSVDMRVAQRRISINVQLQRVAPL